MNIKPVLLASLVTLTMIGCEKKTSKTDVKVPKPDTSKSEEILANLKKPKAGFECELENLDTGDKSQVFYLDRSKESPEKPLYHKLYTVNADKKSVEPNITIGKREIFFTLSYSSENDGIYKATGITVKSSSAVETDEDKKIFSVDANISFDSKVNEFEITLVSKSFDDQSNMISTESGSAKVANCVDAEMIVPLGLD